MKTNLPCHRIQMGSAPLRLAGQNEKMKRPSFSANTAQQLLKHQCVNNIIPILNPKHRKLTLSQPKTG